MSYAVKEIYYTLQGEGANTGRPAVFLRFAGCNLWSGLEDDRETAVCRFCDTDFAGLDGPGGGRFASARELAAAVSAHWPAAVVHSTSNPSATFASTVASSREDAPTPPSPPLVRGGANRFVVCTGGEPLLQFDEPLIAALHAAGFEVAVETNGTRRPPPGIDWLCVSPKAGAELVATEGDELKLVYPQPGAEPERFARLQFRNFYLQPMDGPDRERNVRLATEYCLAHPSWRLSLQTHKLIGIP
ncbi:MAG: 7-carboxy-7-deazaguanine synthase QueE [Planctomycetes bacterium]|nr:7-carboxy-7-deazaguanine synthase QueE [Planctomycetota bacterium]